MQDRSDIIGQTAAEGVQGLTLEAGAFVAALRPELVPQAAVSIACNGLTDLAGVSILARDEPVVKIVERQVRSVGGVTEARLIFSDDRAPSSEAALVNGTAGHALDFDDIGIAAHPAHPSAVLWPAILAEGERIGASGSAMVTAYIAGYEVWGDFARRDAHPHNMRGVHPTGVFGAVAAAAAVANLLRLDPFRAAHAIGLGASQAAGLTGNFASMAKPFHAGLAARAGIVAARLAKSGMTAAPDVIEKPLGFLSIYSPSGAVDTASPPIFGHDWWILRHPLGFKLYPVCYGAHRAVDGLLALMDEQSITAADITLIEAELLPHQLANLVVTDPQDVSGAKFCGAFALAMAATAGRATVSEVTETFLARGDVRDLMARVRLAEAPAGVQGSAPQDLVTLHLVDGRKISRPLRHPRGHPTRPLDTSALWEKFATCTEAALRPAEAEALFACLQTFTSLNDVSSIPRVNRTPSDPQMEDAQQ